MGLMCVYNDIIYYTHAVVFVFVTHVHVIKIYAVIRF